MVVTLVNTLFDMPCIIDLFLLENPLSIIAKSLRVYNTMLYLLELWYNRAFSTERTLETWLALSRSLGLYILPVSPSEILMPTRKSIVQ